MSGDEQSLADLYQQVRQEVTEGARLVDVAEDEISQAMRRHSGEADRIYHAFPLLVPTVTSRGWSTEFVVRGHCRELLDRIGTGGDPKRGTAAECCLVLAEVAKVVPMNGAAAGLYMRMWSLAFPDHLIAADSHTHHEAIYHDQIDDLERELRHKLTVPTRRLEALSIECDGDHHGSPAACRYAVQAQRRAS